MGEAVDSGARPASRAAATVRSSAWLAMAQGASLVLGFLLWAFAARTLGVDTFGQTQLGIAVGTYLALLVSVGTNVLGISELHAQPRARPYVLRVQAIRVAHAIVIVAVLVAAAVTLPQFVPAVIALCAISVVVRELWPEWVDVALGASRRVVGVRSAYFLVVLPTVALFVHTPSDATLFCGILAAAALLVALPAWHFTTARPAPLGRLSSGGRRLPRLTWGSMLARHTRRALPLAPPARSVSSWRMQISCSWGFCHRRRRRRVRRGVPHPVRGARGGGGRAPLVSQGDRRAGARPRAVRVDLFTVTLLMATVMASVCAWCFAPYMIPLAFGSAYSDGVSLLRILAWSWPLDFASAILLNALIVRGVRRRYVTAMSLAAVSNIVANLLLIPRFGAAGAAVVTVASLALLLGFLLCGRSRRSPAPADSRLRAGRGLGCRIPRLSGG